MPLHVLDDRLWFPPVASALEDGLLAVGGDLSEERLLLAYRKGIFPWFEGSVPLWWSPDPRFVLFPEALKISKSMKVLLNRDAFEFKVNTAFNEVIRNCQQVEREGQDGTWITNEVEDAYNNLHEKGYAHSAEAWLNGELVGGLYGIRMGNLFFGESMFSHVSNASKYAFIKYVQLLISENVKLIDCQVYTSHLESLGAVMIPREEFIESIEGLTEQ
ncbi:leucyl/phenylalanyl-tRNA--protein transferase [Filimonas effusa]|uniref:Leucyl/phenylalanyl-tRNA--protein transferase n=1 Tax=Filimonas effusa TaxID=2508721 RepID=A0A4Q1DBV4_9BACT|nr:leucyl/phenylalanyl-tRNA--protein transferase [Filimonas effusa]RXK86927.1 leucyl/phenylalanyl-tRNA--protein transferase [Filimonas effusa]